MVLILPGLLAACGEPEPVREAPDHATLVREESAPVVRVVDRETGVAEPWALVRALDRGDGWPEQLEEYESLDDELLLERYGTKLAANAKGLRRVNPPRGRTLVGVREGARFGSVWLEPGSEGIVPLALEAAPRRSLRVRVLGSTGPPIAGVRVALVEWGRPPGGALPLRSRLRAIAFSGGADGIAELRWTERARADWQVESSAVALGVPMRESIEVPVDLASLHEVPVELRLPLTGSLTVNVVGLDGEPASSGYTVTVSPLAPEPAVAMAWMQQTCRLVAGRAVFSQVALETELLIRVTPGEDSATRLSLERRIAGPVRAAEQLIETFDYSSAAPILTGRVITQGGSPLRGAMVRARIEEPDGSLLPPGLMELSTDREGRFLFGLEAEQERLGGRVLRLQRPNEDGQLRRGLTVDLSYRTLGNGLLELGDLELEGVPRRIGGRVIDEQGAPVEGVDVALGTLSGELFEPDFLLTTRSSVVGDFGIYDWTGGEAAWLRLEHPRFLPMAPIPVVAGERGRNVTVFRGGAVEGAFELPGDLPFRLLQVQLVGRRGELPPGTLAREVRAPLFWDGGFRMSHVPPGEYDAVLVSLARPIVELGPVVVELNETSYLDVAAAGDAVAGLRTVELDVSLSSGEAADPALVELRSGAAPPGAGLETIGAFTNGAVRFVAEGEPFELFVRASGTAVVRLASAALEMDGRAVPLTLPDPQSVHLRWPNPPVPEGHRLVARIDCVVPGVPEHVVSTQRVEVTAGEARFDCLLPGRYRITLPGAAPSPHTIEVLPEPAAQSFELP